MAGILVRPPSVPMSVFEEEITFYGLGRDVIDMLREEEGFTSPRKVDPEVQV